MTSDRIISVELETWRECIDVSDRADAPCFVWRIEYAMVWICTADGSVFGREIRHGETPEGLVDAYRQRGTIDADCTLFRAEGEA